MVKWKIKAVVTAATLFLASSHIYSGSYATYSFELKKETITVLRALEPMVKNFGTKPGANPEPGDDYFVDLAGAYKNAQQSYVTALAYLYERNYIEAYTEYQRCQVQLEKILEVLSQKYIDRARDLLRDATSDMHANPNKADKGVSIMQITVEYGPGSQKIKYFRVSRFAPFESRFYDPLEAHLAYDMQRIENNLNKGYSFVGDAVILRDRAITIEHTMETHKKVNWEQRSKRINWYMKAIGQARKAKRNAVNIFILKYPYENIVHQLDKTAEGKDFKYSENFHYLPRRLHPVFDERVPARYRRDEADNMGYIYGDEFRHKIQGAVWREGEWMKCDKQGKNCSKLQ